LKGISYKVDKLNNTKSYVETDEISVELSTNVELIL
jgi:hypothetical protein